MLIALDYDGTYTADPELWNCFIRNAQNRGHTVIIATMRYPWEIVVLPNEFYDVKIIYTSRKAKFDDIALQGFYPNIWIDDNPHFLFTGG